MRRLLLDTNIYGLIVENQERQQFESLVEKTKVTIYGCSIIRKELRNTPKKEKILTEQGIQKVRLLILSLYDTIIKNHEINITDKTIQLANKYLKQFSEITGKTVLDHLKNDFILVACASLNNLDVVVSEDHKTLLSKEAITAYRTVNTSEDLPLPFLITYEELKTLFRRLSPL